MNTISHYEILEKLGEGGMGVVWKARDLRLERLVALKLLPAAKTADPARRLRFVQEAKAASALNHPRIITIYDIDRSEGPEAADFIAMEFVPGRTLDQLITGKGLRIGEALKYAIQVADALAAAHAAGIVHRDLKPANVMVTEKGDIKVLDFGLAKLIENTGITESDHTRTVAVGQPHTEEGTIMGTAAYMSPEQAEGKKVDARSDIFSFGLVLYEMLAGRRAFQADTKMATMAAILNLEPEPVEKLNPALPRELTRLVQRCLRKDVERRAQSMQDLKLALEEIKEDTDSGLMSGGSAAASAAPRVRRRRGLAAAAGLVVILAAGGAAVWMSRGTTKPGPALKAVPLTSFPGYESTPTFSPDGSQLAFSWNGANQDNYDIYVQLVGAGRPLRLTTDPGRDSSPAWAPDGRSIAFMRFREDGKASVLVVPALGGAEREVTTFEGVRPPSVLNFYRLRPITGWTPDGQWLLMAYSEDSQHAVGQFLVSVETGERRRLSVPPGSGFTGDVMGALSPDGRTLAFVRLEKGVGTGIYLSDIYTIALTAGYQASGEPRRLTSDHTTIGGVAWSGDGRDVVFSSNRGGAAALWRIAASGGEQPRLVGVGEHASSLAISGRANRMVYEQIVSPDSNIWRMDLTDKAAAPAPLIASTRQDESPSYSPDGKRIVFRSDRSGTLEIWTCDADGSNASQLTSQPTSGSPRWSADGSRVAYDSTVNGRWQVFVGPSYGGRPRQVTVNGGTRPSWSHDGKWIYFATPAAGRSEIWKIPVGGGTPVQLSRNGATDPVESADGAYLYYHADAGIARSGLDGGGETVLIPKASGSFAVGQEGVYFAAPGELTLFRFATGKTELVRKMPVRAGFGMSISPDGRWLVYAQMDGVAGSDLMLVEGMK